MGPTPGLRRKGRAFYFDAGGKPRRWIPLGTDEAAALKRYHELVAKPLAGTVDAMLAEYLKSPRAPLVIGTARNYAVYRKHLAEVFGYMNPATLTQAHIVRYLKSCPRTSSRGEIGLLSLAFVNWIDQERLTFNPCFGVRVKRKRSRRTRLLAPEEIEAIIGKCDEREAVAWELQYALGLRIGELCRARWADFETGVQSLKGGARKLYEATPALSALLDRARALQARVASPYVLCNSRGQPWTPDALRQRWHRARKAAGVEDARPHDLRAAGGTEVDRERGRKAAQDFLGHQNEQTTEVYVRDKRVRVVVPLARKAK